MWVVLVVRALVVTAETTAQVLRRLQTQVQAVAVHLAQTTVARAVQASFMSDGRYNKWHTLHK
jgi:hypothetical protein